VSAPHRRCGRTGFYSRLVHYCFDVLRPYFRGTSCCELGPADGQMTEMRIERFDEVVSVEGSSTYCERLHEHFADQGKLEVVCSLFEDCDPAERSTPFLGLTCLSTSRTPSRC